MRVVYEKREEVVTVGMDEPLTLGDVTDLSLNGLRTIMEETLNILQKVNPDISEQEARSEIHDQVVVAFSAMMYSFDPKSKNYKGIE